jgi:aminoglycoside phosphotransferase (APT) family kinase protein
MTAQIIAPADAPIQPDDGQDAEHVLLAAGIAGPGELAGAAVHDVSRSHRVWLVELADGSAYVVKRGGAHGAGRSLDAELYAYRLAAWRTGLSTVFPRAFHLDERHQIVVLHAFPHHQLYSHRMAEPGFPSTRLATGLGEVLATLHAATTDLPLPTAANCGVLYLPDVPEQDWQIGGDSASATAVARAAVGDSSITDALRNGAALSRPRCLVHGDVKWDNIVLDEELPTGVRIFDWELSGRGDPAWDVGCALADTTFLPIRLHGLTALPAHADGWFPPAAGALLASYAASRRMPADDDDWANFADRTTLDWIGRGVQLAVECASSVGDPEHPAITDLLVAIRRLIDTYPEVLPLVRKVMARP